MIELKSTTPKTEKDQSKGRPLETDSTSQDTRGRVVSELEAELKREIDILTEKYHAVTPNW